MAMMETRAIPMTVKVQSGSLVKVYADESRTRMLKPGPDGWYSLSKNNLITNGNSNVVANVVIQGIGTCQLHNNTEVIYEAGDAILSDVFTLKNGSFRYKTTDNKSGLSGRKKIVKTRSRSLGTKGTEFSVSLNKNDAVPTFYLKVFSGIVVANLLSNENDIKEYPAEFAQRLDDNVTK